MSDSDSEEVSLETQFELREDDELYEVLEIIGERKNEYRVRWAGNDPKTKKPWLPSWVPKHDCTDDLVIIWKKQQRKQKEERTRAKEAKKTVKGKGKEKEKERTRKESTEKSSRVTSEYCMFTWELLIIGPSQDPRIRRHPRVSSYQERSGHRNCTNASVLLLRSKTSGMILKTKKKNSITRINPAPPVAQNDRESSLPSMARNGLQELILGTAPVSTLFMVHNPTLVID